MIEYDSYKINSKKAQENQLLTTIGFNFSVDFFIS